MVVEVGIGVAGSVIGAVASSITIWSWLRRPVEALQEKLDRLEQERVCKIERKLESHVEGDRSQAILTTLEALRGEVAKVSNKLDRLGEDSARDAARIDAAQEYIKNLDRSFEKHKSGGHAHG